MNNKVYYNLYIIFINFVQCTQCDVWVTIDTMEEIN